jgi:phosphoribosylformylglycinamidine cyclo-ligase
VVDRTSWSPPAVFEWLQAIGNVEREEMFRVFNMGIGLVLFVDRGAVDQVQAVAKAEGFESQVVGEVLAGETNAAYQG